MTPSVRRGKARGEFGGRPHYPPTTGRRTRGNALGGGGDVEAAADSVTCQRRQEMVGPGWGSDGRYWVRPLTCKGTHAIEDAALSPSSLPSKPSISTFCFSIFPFPHGIKQGFVWHGGESGPGGHFGPPVRSLSCFPRPELMDIDVCLPVPSRRCWGEGTGGKWLRHGPFAPRFGSVSSRLAAALAFKVLLAALRLHCIMSSHPHSGS